MVFAFIVSCFTPTVLFCISNLIIFVILIASKNNISNNNNIYKHFDNVHGDYVFTRVSSFLERTKSIKLSSYTTTTESTHENHPSQLKTANFTSSSRLAQSILTEPSQPVHTPSLLERVSSNFSSSTSQPVSPSSQLTRAPSFLDRVKSFRLSSSLTHSTTTESRHENNPTQLKTANFTSSSRLAQSILTEPSQPMTPASQLTRAPSFLDRVKSFRLSSSLPHNVVTSESGKTILVVKKKKKTKKKVLMGEMKKSNSEMNMARDEEDEDVDLRRPATARENRTAVDDEVDAKADDFISRFRQQLKLQRLESLVRYNELLKRRS